jgi:hypothetical protein
MGRRAPVGRTAFPHPENSLRDFFMDDKGRMWSGSPANHKVGYFYLAVP